MKTFLLILASLLSAVFIVSAFTGCDDSTSNPVTEMSGGPILAVANQAGGAGNLSLIDLRTGAIRFSAAGLGIVPNDIIHHNNRLYIINSHSHSMNVLDIAEDRTLSSVDTFDLGIESNRLPQYGDISTNGRMFISNLTYGTVTVLDMDRMQVIAYLPVGRSPADVMAIENKIYVCNTGFYPPPPSNDSYEPGTVSVISAPTNTVDKTIDVGINPQFLALDPSGRLHIVCTGDYGNIKGEIYIINTEADTVVQVINIGGEPGELAISPNGVAYLAAGGFGDDPAGKVYAYNSLTGQILNGPNNPIEVGLGAQRIVAADNNAIYVACYSADQVDKIVNFARVASYAVGDDPGAMAIFE